MPFFKDVDDVKNNNILFIHIPKTGGTSIETYFMKKSKSDSKELLISHIDTNFMNLGKSPQHLEFKTIKENANSLNIDFNSLTKIITVVRNPYTRIISELFWNKSINEKTSHQEVYNILLNIFKNFKDNENIYDNHIRPQYQYLMENQRNINKQIIILRNEKLNEMMHKIGYVDFNEREQIRSIPHINYFKYLNLKSIGLINKFYKNDFLCFGYRMISKM